jgi:hypothetical protein
MALQYENSEFVIPRGISYFDPEDVSGVLTGEDDLGNVPSITLNVATEKVDHFSSRTGIREKDASYVVQIDRTGKLTSDNVNASNLARWLSSSLETVSQTNTAVVDEVITVVPGRYYQLGRSESNPAGYRNISSLVVEPEGGGTPYVEGEDYEVDLVSARLRVLQAGAIAAGDIQFSCSKVAKTWSRIKTGAVAELRGALRVISDNAAGENRDYYMPKVVLKPTGDLPVITSDTQIVAMEFDLEVLTPTNGSAIYLDDQPVA